MGRWTFGRKIAVAFAVMALLTVVTAVVAVLALDSVVSSKDDVIDVEARALTEAVAVQAAANQLSTSGRGYLLTEDQEHLDRIATAQQELDGSLSELRRLADTDSRSLVESITSSLDDYEQALESAVNLRRNGGDLDAVIDQFDSEVEPARDEVRDQLEAFVADEEQRLEDARDSASDTATENTTLVIVLGVVSAVAAVLLGFVLTRTLRRTIGRSVTEVQSSSAELQAAANQQATGAKEQATAMAEITTTINELLATSRQIAESAQRVSQIADQTAGAGKTGESTIAKAHDLMADIREQVDIIVNHMLELGERSQQIGVVLDIVSELAEQTNILAINSTIEAAGAGEAGRRFGVVADEIRKLADRVTDSTKEIRSLIEVVRDAVNTTVMATEIGSKAVDAGTAEFGEVRERFAEIAQLVATTTDAAREIELSTKQQATAVEQVNAAMNDVAQATRETEASSGQTLQTVSQLAAMSTELRQLVEAE